MTDIDTFNKVAHYYNINNDPIIHEARSAVESGSCTDDTVINALYRLEMALSAEMDSEGSFLYGLTSIKNIEHAENDVIDAFNISEE